MSFRSLVLALVLIFVSPADAMRKKPRPMKKQAVAEEASIPASEVASNNVDVAAVLADIAEDAPPVAMLAVRSQLDQHESTKFVLEEGESHDGTEM